MKDIPKAERSQVFLTSNSKLKMYTGKDTPPPRNRKITSLSDMNREQNTIYHILPPLKYQ
jgi:hypothetical protein